MLATHLGFYNTASTRTHVRFQFSTHAAAGGNVAPNSAFEAADLRIYKAADGAAFSATQRTSANGITMTSPFDSLTGFHDVVIDLTDNTDAGFYAAGSFYSVVLAPDETVDSQTLTGVVLAYFEIGVAKADVTQFGGTAGTFSGGRPEVNTSHAAGTAWNSGAIGASTLASDTIAAAKIATGAITAAKFAADAITSTVVADNTLTAAKIAADAITAAKIANGAIDAATFAADVDAEILSYIVDDATRVDASALNTLSSHDPGEAIMGATDLGTGAGLTSLATQASVNTIDDFLDTEIAAILEDTGTTLDDFIDTEIAAILALLDDARGEPGQGTPPVNPDLATKIDYLYKAWRNRSTQTSSEYALYADDGTTKDHEAACTDDGTTFVRGEITTGA